MGSSKKWAPAWLRGMLGIELSPVSHRERLISALGGCIALIVVYGVTHAMLGPAHAPLVVASMGATAVLLFAVPHGALSQPWPVIGGNALSAVIGVACAQLVPNEAVAAGLAVGLSIAAMHYLRCIHPPGGAAALLAVIGGDPIRALGFGYVLAPVLLNVLLMLATAIAFNALFPWRRYPAYLAHKETVTPPSTQGRGPISHEDFVFALTQLDSFIDISEDDLLRIYALATGRQPAAMTSGAAKNMSGEN
jgi:CBS domain-containing membrane protein